MVYTGTREIDSALVTYQKKVERLVDKAYTDLRKQQEREIRVAMPMIKQEILSLFTMVCYQEFQDVFYKSYGKNYDVNALNKSLSFYIDNNLRPHVLYDVSQFILKTDFNKDKRQFNQNANIEGSFDRLMDFDVLTVVEEMDFYGLSIQEDSPYEWAVEGKSETEDAQVFKRGEVAIEPKYAYKDAEAQAMSKFMHEYETILKPKFKKKYPFFSHI